MGAFLPLSLFASNPRLNRDRRRWLAFLFLARSLHSLLALVARWRRSLTPLAALGLSLYSFKTLAYTLLVLARYGFD